MLTVSLLFPTGTDPRSPYLALPSLAAALRGAGIGVNLHDLDIGGVHYLLEPQNLEAAGRVFRRAYAEGASVPERRLAAISEWSVLPDFASVNWHEAGADEVAALLLRRGVRIEAGIWDATGLDAWRRSPVHADTMRVLVEMPDEAADMVRRHAEGLIAHVRLDDPGIPILLHGEQRSAWPAFTLAVELGLDSRIGLEDTLTLPDGRTAPDNAALVRSAAAFVTAADAGPAPSATLAET